VPQEPALNRSADIAFVTGASGFVGSAVVRALLARGMAVRALVRTGSPRGNLAELDITEASGDLRDADAVARGMAGARYVFHVAADYRLWARDPGEIIRNNLETTRIVAQAALAAGVERLVYTSSVATLKPDPAGPADESRAAAPGEAIGVYKQSKTAAERLIETMVREHALPAVIVNPSTPIGPRDIRPTPTGRIVVEAASGRIPAFVDSGLNVVHVDDVAAGHIAALDRGTIGARYILGGHDVRLRDLLAEIARQTGRRPPRIRLPRRALLPLAWANEQRCRITGADPFLTVDALRMAGHAMYYTSARAERELGYAARPWPLAVADALGWFRTSGMLG
jgi:dihydroflavonol-4-reductase